MLSILQYLSYYENAVIIFSYMNRYSYLTFILIYQYVKSIIVKNHRNVKDIKNNSKSEPKRYPTLYHQLIQYIIP